MTQLDNSREDLTTSTGSIGSSQRKYKRAVITLAEIFGNIPLDVIFNTVISCHGDVELASEKILNGDTNRLPQKNKDNNEDDVITNNVSQLSIEDTTIHPHSPAKEPEKPKGPFKIRITPVKGIYSTDSYKSLTVLPSIKHEAFLQFAAKTLGISKPTGAYDISGLEITQLEVLRPDDLVVITQQGEVYPPKDEQSPNNNNNDSCNNNNNNTTSSYNTATKVHDKKFLKSVKKLKEMFQDIKTEVIIATLESSKNDADVAALKLMSVLDDQEDNEPFSDDESDALLDLSSEEECSDVSDDELENIPEDVDQQDMSIDVNDVNILQKDELQQQPWYQEAMEAQIYFTEQESVSNDNSKDSTPELLDPQLLQDHQMALRLQMEEDEALCREQMKEAYGLDLLDTLPEEPSDVPYNKNERKSQQPVSSTTTKPKIQKPTTNPTPVVHQQQHTAVDREAASLIEHFGTRHRFAITREYMETKIRRDFNNMHVGNLRFEMDINESFRERFNRAWDSLERTNERVLPVLCYHGTSTTNIRSILTSGLVVPGQGNSVRVVHGSALGLGIYLALHPSTSLGYCSGSPTSMLLCAALVGSRGVVANTGSVLVISNAAQVLVCGVIRMTTPQPAAVATRPATVRSVAKPNSTKTQRKLDRQKKRMERAQKEVAREKESSSITANKKKRK